MTQDTHDLVAAYALDSLDEGERERFQRHLAECEDCTEQLALLQGAATALAYGAEGPEPSPSLRGRILAAAAAEAEPEPHASVIRFPRRNWGLSAVAGVAAVAAVAALALGLWANSLSNSLDRERSANEAYERTAQILGANASATPLVGADGSLLVADDGRAALVICGLDQAPSEKTYEAWVISGTTPTPAGLFQGSGDCQPVALTRSVPSGATVGVTVEEAGGATSPTLPLVFRAQPA